MPMIELTVPEGALTPDGRESIQQDLARVLLRWEGAPDTPMFRANAWSYLREIPAGAQTTAEDQEPRFRVEVRVPEGALSDRRRAGLVKDTTDVVLAAAGLTEQDAGRVWVLVTEQTEGTWGAGGAVIRFQELIALARQAKEAASA